jgi:hypothetical protein
MNTITTERENKFTQNAGKHLLRISRRRYGNIKMDLREVGFEDPRWVKLAHDRVQWRPSVLALSGSFYFSVRECRYV